MITELQLSLMYSRESFSSLSQSANDIVTTNAIDKPRRITYSFTYFSTFSWSPDRTEIRYIPVGQLSESMEIFRFEWLE